MCDRAHVLLRDSVFLLARSLSSLLPQDWFVALGVAESKAEKRKQMMLQELTRCEHKIDVCCGISRRLWEL